MTYAVVRDGIEAALNTVTNVGRVHDYWRYDSNVKTFVEHYKTTISGVAQVRAWIVQFTGIEPLETSMFATDSVLYTFQISGYRGVNDAAASEKEFMELAEDVMRALSQKKNFGASDVALYSTKIGGVSADHAMFAETLCHRVRISLTVEVDSPMVWS